MKKKKLLIVLLTLFSLFTFSQKRIANFNLELKTSYSEIKDVIPVVNEENGDIVMFVADAKNVYAYKLNKEFKVIDKVSSEQKKRKYKTIIGHSISEKGDYNLYLTNNDKTSFLVVKFSFTERKTKLIEHKLKTKHEKFIQSVSHKNQFYIISAAPAMNGFAVYSFKDNGNYKGNSIATNISTEFLSKRNKKINIGKLLYNNRKNISKIADNVPNSIEVAASSLKIYTRNNSLLFTFDNNNLYTQVLNLNLLNFESSVNRYEKPMRNISTKKKTNSFINGDKIFLLSSYHLGLQLNICDINSSEILKEYKILRKQPITFKNTPIIQEGGFYNGYREMEKTRKFIRKVNSGKIGVSVKKLLKGNYQITLGGYVEQKRSSGMFMPMGFGGIPLATFGNAAIFFNPTQFAFNSYANSKSTRIESLMDKKFNHIKGEIEENVFDKIKEYSSDNDRGNSIFKYRNFYIKTNYNSSLNEVSFRKFEE